MARYLKEATAVDVMIGPFLDETDGKTAETGLTLTQPDIRLSKNGAAFAQKSAAQTLSHGENGYYSCNLSTTDTGTIGRLRVAVHESGALPVWEDFHVLAANIFDSIFGAATDKLEVDLLQVGGDAQSATDLKDFADAGYDPSTNKVQGVVLTDTVTTYTGNTPQTGDSYAVVNSGTHGNAALKTLIDAIDDYVDSEVAAIKAKTDALPADPADASDIAALFSSLASTLATIATYIDTEVAAIKAKTDNLPTDPADASDIAASFTTVNTKLDTIDDFLDTEVAAIKAKTDGLTFTVAGSVDANIQRVNDVAVSGTGASGDEWGPA